MVPWRGEEVGTRLQRERSCMRFWCTRAWGAVTDRILVLWASYPPRPHPTHGPPGLWRLRVFTADRWSEFSEPTKMRAPRRTLRVNGDASLIRRRVVLFARTSTALRGGL